MTKYESKEMTNLRNKVLFAYEEISDSDPCIKLNPFEESEYFGSGSEVYEIKSDMYAYAEIKFFPLPVWHFTAQSQDNVITVEPGVLINTGEDDYAFSQWVGFKYIEQYAKESEAYSKAVYSLVRAVHAFIDKLQG